MTIRALVLIFALLIASPAIGAIAQVQKNSSGAGGNPTNLAFSSNNTAGNFLIYMAVTLGSAATITDSNNTPVQIGTALCRADVCIVMYYVANCAGGANTVTVSGETFVQTMIAEYSGIATASPFDQTNTGNNFGTAVTTASITTTQNDELLIMAVGGETPFLTFTPGGSFTEQGDLGDSKSAEWQDRIVSSTGSYSGAATASGSTNWVARIASFKAAAGGAVRRNLPLLGVGM